MAAHWRLSASASRRSASRLIAAPVSRVIVASLLRVRVVAWRVRVADNGSAGVAIRASGAPQGASRHPGGAALLASSGALSPGVPVQVAAARRGTIREFVDEQAVTRLPRTYSITMPQSGRIEPITLQEGSRVARGQVVARINPSDLDLEVAEAKAVVERLEGLSVWARRVVSGGAAGLHRSLHRGASVEFRQHRFYVPGDEPRRIDWRVLARTDRPFVREFDDETNLHATLLLDASGSMGYGAGMSKIEYAARVCAAVAYLLLGSAESVGLGIIAEGLETWVKSRAGSGQLARLVDALERVNAHGPGEDRKSVV